MRKIIRLIILSSFLVTSLMAKNLTEKKPVFGESCDDFAYNGILEDMAIEYLKYAKKIIEQNTAFIEVTKFDFILYKLAFGKCLMETVNDLRAKIMDDSAANILEESILPLDFLQGESANTPSKAIEVKSEPDVPFTQILLNLFKDSAEYVSEHLLKCTFQKFHSYQRFIANHINNSFKLKMNTYNFISRLCNYELVREDEEYNPIIVQERDKILSKVNDLNKKINNIINSPHPIDTLNKYLEGSSTDTQVIETNTTKEISRISYAIKNDILEAGEKLDNYFKTEFVKKPIQYKNTYLFNFLGKIEKFHIDKSLNNDLVQKNLVLYSDLFNLFLSYLDSYYKNTFSNKNFKYVIPMFYKTYKLEDKIIFINTKNDGVNLDMAPRNFSILKLNDRLSKISLYDNNDNLMPNNVKKALIILAYMNTYLYNNYDKSLYRYVKQNKDILNKYGTYYALNIDVKINIIEYLNKLLLNEIKPFIVLGTRVKELNVETTTDYEINYLINLLNNFLVSYKNVKDINDIDVVYSNETKLNISVFNNTLKFRQNCNIYERTEEKEICTLLKENFFKDFDIYSGLQENTNSIVKGFIDEVDEINTYTTDKQFNAKIDEIQVDYNYIDSK